jgi:hypothetical protein
MFRWGFQGKVLNLLKRKFMYCITAGSNPQRGKSWAVWLSTLIKPSVQAQNQVNDASIWSCSVFPVISVMLKW